MRLKILLLLLIMSTYASLDAQQSIYSFTKLDISDGLSNNQVNAVFKDSHGFMWFGTMSGLNRFDGYTFRVFKHDFNDSTSLSDDFIISIREGPGRKIWVNTRDGWNIFNLASEKFDVHPGKYATTIGLPDASFTEFVNDGKGNFWFIYPGKGVYRYDEGTSKLVFYHKESNHYPLSSNNVSSLSVAKNGDAWIVYRDGVMDKIDHSTGIVSFRSTAMKQPISGLDDFKIFIDHRNELWVYKSNGVYVYSPASDKARFINKDSRELRLSPNVILAISEDNNGNIWIGTDHGGINLINRERTAIQYLVNNENEDKSLSQNSIYSIYKDNTGIMWLGTFKKGINYFHSSTVNFPLVKHNQYIKNSLPYDDINQFLEDDKGNLWLGTNGGGLVYFDRQQNTFKSYRHDPKDPASLSTDVIVSLCLDHANKLWIGTYFGGLDCFDGSVFTHYKNDPSDTNSLADNRVWKIMEDSRNRLWVGTLAEGLDLFDRENKRFIHYKTNAVNSIHSTYISDMLEDRHGNIWIGTAYGIDVLENKTGTFTHYLHQEDDPASLSQNNVIDLFEDSRGYIWAGTRDGLNVFDPAKKRFTSFRKNNGLPDNIILNILEDNNRNLWISTSSGLVNGIVQENASGLKMQFIGYDESDGLQGKQFNEKAALRTSKGEMIFGGANGFNIFWPKRISLEKSVPHLVLTDMQIFNKSVRIGQKYSGQVILPQAVSGLKLIKLPYNQNVFTFEFANLSYFNASKIKYAYQLEGFHEEWLTTDAKNRNATFTNLNPGDYNFKVKIKNEDGSWSAPVSMATIRILPPFWLTPLAYLLYFLGLLAVLIFGRKKIIHRARQRFALEQERQEAQRLHEFDMMKIRFFTNVSHEFRTPLSLIISPVDKMLGATRDPDARKQFMLIQRNARRLLNLVNQLLDFRKMEEKELKLNETPGQVVEFIREVCLSFSDLAHSRNIDYSFNEDPEKLYTLFDHEKLERILFNLLSNAFKFTPGGGKVSVKTEVLWRENDTSGMTLKIGISDSGIGIEKEKQEKIFERFFQNDIPDSMVNQGSGIGLSITKEFVKLLKGSISVDSLPGKGSTFIVSLPIEPLLEDVPVLDHPEKEVQPEEPEEEVLPVNEKVLSGTKKTILVIEDNDDFRFYIKSNLQEYFHIEEAENGKMGWNKTLSVHPDLVLCDISMPEMNGIDLCRKIRADKRTSFIPVIMLTALTGDEQVLRGLKVGANDYLTKPFNVEVLLSKVENILSQQDSFRKTYQKQVQVLSKEVEIESADEKFIQQALTIVEENISNPGFSVEEMSRKLFMSRVSMYKKLFSLTGKTPIEFIRTIRLQRAAQLLECSQMTISEIAYEVGFNNPKHFSKVFKNEFNTLPSAYILEKKKEFEWRKN